MAYFKLTILSITGLIGIMHSLVNVSCQIFQQPPGIGLPNNFLPGNGLSLFPRTVLEPVPALDRRSDERRTVILVEDSTLQNGGEFDSGFGVGFDGGLQNGIGFEAGIGGGFNGGFGSILALLFIPFLLMVLGLGVNTTTASVTGTTAMDTAITTPAVAVFTTDALEVATVAAVTTAVSATTALTTTPLDTNGGGAGLIAL